MEAFAELVRAAKAYLAVDGSNGTFDHRAMDEARGPLRLAIAAAEDELLWEQRFTVAEAVESDHVTDPVLQGGFDARALPQEEPANCHR